MNVGRKIAWLLVLAVGVLALDTDKYHNCRSHAFGYKFYRLPGQKDIESGSRVDLEELQSGDVVIYEHHAAKYAGNGYCQSKMGLGGYDVHPLHEAHPAYGKPCYGVRGAVAERSLIELANDMAHWAQHLTYLQIHRTNNLIRGVLYSSQESNDLGSMANILLSSWRESADWER